MSILNIIKYKNHEYKLCGVICFGSTHFTSIIVRKYDFWYYDGIETKNKSIYYKSESEDNGYLNSLEIIKSRNCSVALYIKCN